MSRVIEISPKDCATKQPPHIFNNTFFIYLSILSLTLFSCLLLVCLMSLHPSKPEFSITRAHINRLNLTRPSNSSILFIIQSHNPNKNTGIFYEEISVSASYKGQQMTPLTQIVPFYQDQEATNYFSTDLKGNQQTAGPVLGYQVQNDQRAENLGLNFEINGKLKWQVGYWKSAVHGFFVNCYIIIPFRVKFPHVFSYSRGMECSTTI